MRNEDWDGAMPFEDDDHDLRMLLDYPRAALVASAPGGLARLMRAVEAVRVD